MFVVQDFIHNGAGHGPFAQHMQRIEFDPGMMRPWLDDRNRLCVTLNAGFDSEGKPKKRNYFASEIAAKGYTINATTLRKDDWIMLDKALVKAARQRLRAWSDLAAVSSFGGFDGMAKSVLEYETMSDPGEALTSMYASIAAGNTDSPQFQLEGLPLPITHSDFFFDERRLAISRNSGTPLDVTQAEAAGRRIAEKVEQSLIFGINLQYGPSSEYSNTPKIYGYTNHPDRNTKTDLTTPTGSNGPTVLTDILEMRDQLYSDNHFGPFMLYHSTDYDIYMDNLFSTSEPSAGTLRDRIRKIDGITDVRRLDYLPASTNPFTLIMVEMVSEVARAVTGMPLQTVRWDTVGGMQKNFKVMTIMVPQIRADYYGNCGIVHATTS